MNLDPKHASGPITGSSPTPANPRIRAFPGVRLLTAGSEAHGEYDPLRIAILSFDDPDHACARLRVLGPLGAPAEGIELVWGLERRGDLHCIVDGIHDADVFVVQRMFPCKQTFEILHAVLRSGRPVVYETDDLLVKLPRSNPHFASIAERVPLMKWMIRDATVVTVSTPELARALDLPPERVRVLPNYLDPALWTRTPPKVERAPGAPLVIGFAGTTTHLADLALVEEALVRISKRFGARVAFRFFGCATERLRRLPGFSFMNFEPGYASYAQALPRAGIDVGLVPLQDSAFNRCKSNVKWLEYGIAGIAGVYSDLPPYQANVRHGVNGLLVSPSTDAWYSAIAHLIEHPEVCRGLAERACAEVASEHTLATGRARFLSFYRDLVRSRAKTRS